MERVSSVDQSLGLNLALSPSAIYSPDWVKPPLNAMTTAPILSAIYIYPVKSCRGIPLTSARLNTWGLEYDRNWMAVNAEGHFLTQRQLPRLALVETALEPKFLRLTAPNMPELRLSLSDSSGRVVDVKVWRDRCQALDQGDEVAEWFSTFLSTTCRLVRISEGYDRPVDRDYAPQDAQVSFADGFPLLTISEATLSDLNARLAEPLPMNRFRPNLVVSGCEPYAEDSWHTICIGDVTFYGVKPCQRCIITTIDQTTGIGGREPLATLTTYRRVKGGVILGQNLVHAGSGEVRLGSVVEVLRGEY